MKKFFTWLWEGIKRQFMMFIVSTWYVWVAVILAVLVGLIFGWNVSVWVFFGLVGAVIAYVALRQLYWLFTGTGDYQGRGIPALWKKIFKK
jgi:hypothetical protein